MIHRSTPLDIARRVFNTLVRGGIHEVDDSTKVQNVALRLLNGELITKAERIQTYAHSSVPPKPGGGGIAEAVVGFISGARSHPIVIAADDRRSRPKNLKPGESIAFDDQGQYSRISRDGHHRVAKQHTLTSNDQPSPGGVTQPDTSFELNEQLAGLSARMAQAEHAVHGLFDVTSRFRAIVQEAIPGVAAVAPILNQDPSGLQPMADAISGKEAAYLQQQIGQALQKFLSPNIGAVASVLPAGLEASIGSLQTQVASLVSTNPVISQVDSLAQQLSDLASSGATAGVISAGTTLLQDQISALTAANPIIGQIAGLRSTLAGLISEAGPTLNFLAPQQRLVQKLSKSLRLIHSGG